MDGQSIQQVRKAELLGLWLNSPLSWSDHVNIMVLKMGRAVATAKKNVHLLFHHHCFVKQFVLWFYVIRIIVVWSSAFKELLRKLQIARNRAARLVLGCSPSSSMNDMHNQLKWLIVETRLAANLLVYFHGVNNTQIPKFLFKKIIYSSEIQWANYFTLAKNQLPEKHGYIQDHKLTAPASKWYLFHQRKGMFLFFFKIYFLGAFVPLYTGYLKSGQETVEREGERHAAKGHRWNRTRVRCARTKPLCMGCLLYRLSHQAPRKCVF